MESLAVLLRRVPLLADLPPGSFAKIIADLREEIVEPGGVVCAEGDVATDFYVIRSGEVSVYVHKEAGEPELVDTMGANEWFGESALFHERRRSATIVANTRVDLWRLPKDKFNALIEDNPSLILHFTGVVLDRLQAENRRLAHLIQASRSQAEGTLAREPHDNLRALEALSVLETLDAPACAAVLANVPDVPDASTFLARLAGRSDLVQQGKDGMRFIVPVREGLQAGLLARIGEDGVRTLRRRAADALRDAGEPAKSIDLRLAAGDFDDALTAVLADFSSFVASEGPARLASWLASVPHDARESDVAHEVDARIGEMRARDVATSAVAPQAAPRGALVLGALLAAAAAGAVAFLVPMPGLADEGRQMLALLAAAVVLWALDTVPDYVVGLGMMLAWIVLGTVPTTVALSGFTSSPFFLITGVLGLAAALQTSGLLFRMALYIIRRFPPSHRGQLAGLSLSGTAITSCVPDVTSGVAIAAPITLALSDSLGFDRRSRGSTSIAMAAVLGFGQMSPFFLTGAAENLVGRSLLPEAAQADVTWMAWFIAALPLALVTYACGFAATVLLYRPERSPRISRATLDAQIEALGRASWSEIVNGIVLCAAVVGWLTSPYHGIDVAWIAMGALTILLGANLLDRATFRTGIHWDFLFYLGTVLSLTEVVRHLGLDDWLIHLIEPTIAPMVQHPTALLLILAVTIYAARFVLPSIPLVSLLVLTVVPITSAAGIKPMVLLIVLSTAASVWFMPYQSPYYLALYFGTKEQAFTHRQARPMAWAYGAIYLLAIAAGIPVWHALGLLQ